MCFLIADALHQFRTYYHRQLRVESCAWLLMHEQNSWTAQEGDLAQSCRKLFPNIPSGTPD
ncbi:hypothetical protein SAMN05444003_1524 [Cognatiyoonia sediminum]|uniref:Uncharacterized protein n=1 Tax=Cognatiyoonia sediminum TaxID=1508389 RepID=A0A1M5NP42_9RHOB|nr:hypothetical protein SAMN05444003_1524 [Cognatiyoonia sediminum]